MTSSINSHNPTIHALLQQKCSSLRDLQQIHAQLITTGFIQHPHSLAKLLSLSLSLSPQRTSLSYASMLFNRSPHQPNPILWNTLLRGFTNKNLPELAIAGYLEMLQDPSTPPDRFTFPSLLKACAQSPGSTSGSAIHGQILKLGLGSDLYTQTTLISTYSSSGDTASARTVFDRMDPRKKNAVAWTSMINAYAKSPCPGEALRLFSSMDREGLAVDAVAMATAISACGEAKDLVNGEKLHRRVMESGTRVCVVLGTALVDMYSKCGELGLAREAFDSIPAEDKNVVCWSAMISGYSQNNRSADALRLFREMVADSGHRPNEITAMAALSACAQAGDLSLGKWVHAYVDRAQLNRSIGLMNSLVDMYSKCGKIELAFEIFNGMPIKDIVSWNAMINGLALHGSGDRALDQFGLMQEAGVAPDDITFIGVLTACSHGGLLEDGFLHFQRMRETHGIEPKLEHYGCIADMLSRAGRLEEAEKFIGEMPMEPNGAVWGALLGGCRVYNDAEIGERAARRLLDIEPHNDGVYVLLSNIFARKRRWEEVRRVRLLMHRRGVRKAPGCSSIVVDGVSHEFTVGDSSHQQI